ncbi:MAG: copper chaperone PCu(A)C [Arenimonas sp.]
MCAPRVEKGWIRAAPLAATSFAGYAVVHNDCPKPVVITGVKGHDFMMAMIHRTAIEAGVSQMRHVKLAPIPAGSRLTFSPGGMHMMLMHPRRALPPGTLVRIELILADGRSIPAELTVRREPPP